MSYYTVVTCEIYPTDKSEFATMKEDVSNWLTAKGYSLNLLEDIESSLTDADYGFNKVYAPPIIDLYQFISTLFPYRDVRVQGIGEEIDDIWYRHFKNGEVLKAIG